jgi:hypothetical protein
VAYGPLGELFETRMRFCNRRIDLLPSQKSLCDEAEERLSTRSQPQAPSEDKRMSKQGERAVRPYCRKRLFEKVYLIILRKSAAKRAFSGAMPTKSLWAP